MTKKTKSNISITLKQLKVSVKPEVIIKYRHITDHCNE